MISKLNPRGSDMDRSRVEGTERGLNSHNKRIVYSIGIWHGFGSSSIVFKSPLLDIASLQKGFGLIILLWTDGLVCGKFFSLP